MNMTLLCGHELRKAAGPLSDDQRGTKAAFDGVFKKFEPARLVQPSKHDACLQGRILLVGTILFFNREILVKKFVTNPELAFYQMVLEARRKRIYEIILGNPSLGAVQVPQHDDSVNVKRPFRRRKHGVKPPLSLDIAAQRERQRSDVVDCHSKTSSVFLSK